jgi:hypothetical protein
LQVNVNSCATHRAGRCVALTVALCAMVFGARQLRAQTPGIRFFGAIGGGIGESGPAQSLGQDQYKGPTADVILGYALTTRGVAGIDVSGFHKDTPFGTSRTIFGTLTLLGYPFGSALSNLFFQGGLGVGNGNIPVNTGGSTVTQMNLTHPALLVALGYDIPIACPLWITPFFQSYGTFGGHRITSSGNVHESANVVLYHGGFRLTYSHPGAAGQCRHRAPALTE